MCPSLNSFIGREMHSCKSLPSAFLSPSLHLNKSLHLQDKCPGLKITTFCAKFSGPRKTSLKQRGTNSGLQSDKGSPDNNDSPILPFPGNIHSRLRRKATQSESLAQVRAISFKANN